MDDCVMCILICKSQILTHNTLNELAAAAGDAGALSVLLAPEAVCSIIWLVVCPLYLLQVFCTLTGRRKHFLGQSLTVGVTLEQAVGGKAGFGDEICAASSLSHSSMKC